MIIVLSLVLVLLLILLMIFVLCLRQKGENFKTVEQHTGIEKDSCIHHSGHVFTDELRNRCNDIKFDFLEENDTYSLKHNRRVQEHNSGERCLNSCVFDWKERREGLYRLLGNIYKINKKLGLPWVLYYGALLGWFRSGELIPWDSDIDILMDVSILKNEGMMYEDSETIMKIENRFPIIGSFIDKKTGMYCDIFCYSRNNDKVNISWLETKKGEFLEVDSDKFFPFRKSSLQGVPIFVPNCPETNLRKRYGRIERVPYHFNNDYWIKN